MNAFFALVFRQKYITRWALMRNVRQESLSEHAAETAVLAHGLAVIGNRIFGAQYDADHIAALALYHDLPEVLTGDLPTPVKYHSAGIRRDYAELEQEAVERLLASLPEELRDEYAPLLKEEKRTPEETRLIKAADKLAAYLKCVEEEKSGNTEFRSAAASISQALHAMACPELDYFMEHLLPAMRLTLDEISD